MPSSKILPRTRTITSDMLSETGKFITKFVLIGILQVCQNPWPHEIVVRQWLKTCSIHDTIKVSETLETWGYGSVRWGSLLYFLAHNSLSNLYSLQYLLQDWCLSENFFCVQLNARTVIREAMTELSSYFMLSFIFADKRNSD